MAKEDKEEIKILNKSFFCHPQSLGHKLIVLFLLCFLLFGSYYCYDSPGALQTQMETHYNLTSLQFGNLYAWYSWPNVVLPFIGGYLIDGYLGIRRAAIVFSAFILIGQLVFGTGAMFGVYEVLILGRFIFGVGGESLGVAQNTYASTWFAGKALNMVFGLLLSISRLASSVNYQTVGKLFSYLFSNSNDGVTAIGWTLVIVSSTCFLSLLSAIILAILDKRAAKILQRKDVEQEKFHLKDVLSFPFNFWILSVVCVTCYVSILPFISFGQKFLVVTFGYTDNEANTIISLPYIISAFAAPFFGWMVDRLGRNLIFVLTSTIFLAISHILFIVPSVNPSFSIVLLGIGYSLLASSLWPIIPLLLPAHQLGTGFGIIQAIQNIGLSLIPMVVGIIIDTNGYIWVQIFYVISISIALVSTFLMIFWDKRNNDGYLIKSPSQR